MLSFITRKEIYIRRFINHESLRKISKDLKIGRVAVTKYANRYAMWLKEHEVIKKDDILNRLNDVLKSDKDKHKIRNKINPSTYNFIEKLYNKNEGKKEAKKCFIEDLDTQYKISQNEKTETLSFIQFKKNEELKVSKDELPQTITEMYRNFVTIQKTDDNSLEQINTNITYNSFYKVIAEIRQKSNDNNTN